MALFSWLFPGGMEYSEWFYPGGMALNWVIHPRIIEQELSNISMDKKRWIIPRYTWHLPDKQDLSRKCSA